MGRVRKHKKLKWYDPGNRNNTWGKDLNEFDPKKNLPITNIEGEEKLNYKLQFIADFQKTGVVNKVKKRKRKELEKESERPNKKTKNIQEKTTWENISWEEPRKLAERKKDYLNYKKKKNGKNNTNNNKEDDNDNDILIDKVAFGEVVDRPPKLLSKPKTRVPITKPKQTPTTQERAYEIMRMKVVESYKQANLRKRQKQ